MSPKRSTSCRLRAIANTIRPMGKLRVYRSRTGGNEWEPLTKGLPQENCYGQRVARCDGCRLARFVWRVLWHNWGQVYAVGRCGRHLAPIVRDLPPYFSGGPGVMTRAMIRIVMPGAFADACGRQRGDVTVEVDEIDGDVTRTIDSRCAGDHSIRCLRGTIRETCLGRAQARS